FILLLLLIVGCRFLSKVSVTSSKIYSLIPSLVFLSGNSPPRNQSSVSFLLYSILLIPHFISFLSTLYYRNTTVVPYFLIKIKSSPLRKNGSLSKRTDAKILIIIFKLLDGSLIVFLF